MAARSRFQTDDNGPPKKKRKVKKANVELEVVAPNASLDGLPDNIILAVMCLLDIRSLVRLSQVCRRFHHLHSDECIWSCVDLTRESVGSRIDSKLVKKIIRTHVPASLIKVELSCNAFSHKSKNPVITVSLLQLLFDKCPQIQSLSLQCCNLTTFPRDCSLYHCQTLQSLTLYRCETKLRWFQDVRPSWPHLSHLSLEMCVMITNDDLKHIANCTEWQASLRSISLRGCYRVTDDGVMCMCEMLTSLKEIDLRDCRPMDSVAKNGKLKHINIMYTPVELA